MKHSATKRFAVWGLALLAASIAAAAYACGHPAPHHGIAVAQALGDLDAQKMAPIGMAGMLVNKETIGNVFVGLKSIFNNAFGQAPSNWKKVAMLVPSTTSENDYSWLSNFPKMREWIGEKVVKSLAAFNYTVKNKDFEATVEVDRNDIEDDNLGIYGPQAQMAGVSAAELPDDLVFKLLAAGFTTKCYDGQYFIDTDHPVKQEDGTIASVSNKGTKALSVASLADANAGLGAADVALLSMKDDEGRSLNITGNLLVVAPGAKLTAQTLLTTDRLEDGKPNPYKGAYELHVETRLSGQAWFLMDTTKPIKPIIYQERKKPVFVQQTGMDAEDVFMKKKFKFGAEARANVGYSFWQLVYGSTGTVA